MSVTAIATDWRGPKIQRSIVYRDPEQNLVIEASTRVKPALRTLLERTVWGDCGARFKSLGIADRLAQLESPVFMTLEKEGQVIGGYCFSRRELSMRGKRERTLYRTGFTVDEAHQGSAYGRLLAQVSKSYFETQEPSLALSYGLVESRNLRCLNALEAAGYESIGSFDPLVFSRFHPRLRMQPIRLAKSQLSEWKDKLYKLYQKYTLVHFDGLDQEGGYFLAKKAGQIVAGVQAHVTQMSLKGLRAWPRFLLPKGCRFLAFEALYCPVGNETDLYQLLESLLYKYQVRYGLLFLDRRSSLYKGLKSSHGLGLINGLCRPEPIQIMAAGRACASRSGPFYIAASDLI